jgi:dolichol-phosphate mannosyltransferase
MDPQPIEVSVICPVGTFVGDLAAVHREFREILRGTGRRAEFLYVLGGRNERAERGLAAIDESLFPVRVFRMAKGFGEAAKLEFAFEQARGRYVLIIPALFQVDPGGSAKILEHLDEGWEVVVTRREGRRDPLVNRLQSKVFHGLIRKMTGGQVFRDLTCGLRGLTVEAARKLDLYGDLHRFIPVLAARRGFRVLEIPVAQRSEDRALRVFGPGVYARRLLDILNVFFLTRFTRKPLRFFGLLGMASGLIGAILCAILAAQRLLVPIALANRPLLILGVLLVVLGVQLISIGLIGEVIIFLSARREIPEVREVESEDPGGGRS